MDKTPVKVSWQGQLHHAIALMLAEPEFQKSMSVEHVNDTPRRFVEAFQEYFSGLKQNPEEVLRTGFEPGNYDEMIYVRNVRFTSFCAHHLSPFIGKVHFAYLPSRKIIGLSKIPRLIEIYSRRPQVQEKLSAEIVDTFQRIVQPKGCGVVIEAVHLCMTIRGVRKEEAETRTTALTGVFRDSAVKSEFLDGIRK